MKFFFNLGNRYAEQSNWTDFALTKFCLAAVGIIIGILIPAKHKKPAGIAAAGVFAVTYAVLMSKVFKIALAKEEE